ncbi:MAG: hypothetical protein K6T86_18145 [Pirellulales bacterium]|nr:hypothetical protein [Pirellulales bacterium]
MPWLCWSLLCCALAAQEAGAPPDDVDAVIESLDGAIDASRHGLEFTATFVGRTGFARSEQDALAGRCQFFEGKGILAKKGEVVRYSYRTDPDAPGHQGFREECVETRTLSLHAMASDKPLHVQIEPRAETAGRQLGCARYLSWPFNPLGFSGAFDGAPLGSILRHNNGVGWRLLRKDVRQEEGGRLLVTLVHEARGGAAEYTDRITFGFRDGMPVIERREIHCRGECTRPPRDLKTVIMALRFVKVVGGWLPSHTRRVMGPGPEKELTGEGGDAMGFKVEEWYSEDMGRRPPQPEDFVVNLPPGSYVSGARVADPTRIDLVAMSQEDLWRREDYAWQRPTLVLAPDEGGDARWIYVGVAVCVLGIAMACLGVWRARRRRKENV